MAVNQPTPVSDSEKIELAKKFKAEGNECHKNKDYKRAMGKYHRALLQLKAIGNAKSAGLGAFLSEKSMEDLGYSQHIPDSVRVEVTKLTGDCYNNLAACLLQQPDPNYTRIVEYCNNVVEMNPENVKAFYRRGLGLYHLEKYEEALESFDQAESVAANKMDKGLKAKLNEQVKLCKEGLRKQNQQLRDAYKGMFNKKPSANETEEKG
ncbi:Tetratricopeptide repeat protein 9C [Mactra antiquata]